MSFEDTFDRIALALESIAASLQPQQISGSTTTGQIVVTDTSSTAGTLAEPAPAKKPRGRPAKITADEKATATPAQIVEDKPAPVQPAGAQIVDDFLSPAPAAKPPTLEELRAALQAYAVRNDVPPGQGMAKARELLTKYGNGASRLAVAKDVPGGDQGVIEPVYYTAVINAARAT